MTRHAYLWLCRKEEEEEGQGLGEVEEADGERRRRRGGGEEEEGGGGKFIQGLTP